MKADIIHRTHVPHHTAKIRPEWGKTFKPRTSSKGADVLMTASSKNLRQVSRKPGAVDHRPQLPNNAGIPISRLTACGGMMISSPAAVRSMRSSGLAWQSARTLGGYRQRFNVEDKRSHRIAPSAPVDANRFSYHSLCAAKPQHNDERL